VGYHWSRDIPVCVSASGFAIRDSGCSYSIHHWQSNYDSSVCRAAGFGVCYGEFPHILFFLFNFFLLLLLLLVSTLLPSHVIACFVGEAMLFSFSSSAPFPLASPILIYNYCIYLDNLCLHNLHTPTFRQILRKRNSCSAVAFYANLNYVNLK
jgi:hypothetical protein